MIYEMGTITDLLKDEKKNIYCFGAGRVLDSFLKEFRYLNIHNNIKAITDNNMKTLKEAVKTIENISIPIISVKQMLYNIEPDDRILITASAYDEIIVQLEKIEKLDYIKCYVYCIMRIEQYDYERLTVQIPRKLSCYDKIKIPKVIHYCWFGKKNMPIQYKMWIDSWKYFCPDYEIIEWNEDNYNVHKCRYVRQAYEMGKWAFVSDYARVDIINEFGGVYLDTDVELLKNIDELLMNNAFCGFETKQYVSYALGFGAQKGNSIINEIKEYYEKVNFLLENGEMNLTTCPKIQTQIMKRHGLFCNGKYQVVDGMTVYPERILCGMSPYSYRVEQNQLNTYAIHHFQGSWIGDNDKNIKENIISKVKQWSQNNNYIYLN